MNAVVEKKNNNNNNNEEHGKHATSGELHGSLARIPDAAQFVLDGALELDRGHVQRGGQVLEEEEMAALEQAGVTSAQTLVDILLAERWTGETLGRIYAWSDAPAFDGPEAMLGPLRAVVEYGERIAGPEVRTRLRWVAFRLQELSSAGEHEAVQGVLGHLAAHGGVCHVQKEIAIRYAYGALMERMERAAGAEALPGMVERLLAQGREECVEWLYRHHRLGGQTGPGSLNSHPLVGYRNAIASAIGVPVIPDQHTLPDTSAKNMVDVFFAKFYSAPYVMQRLGQALNSHPRKVSYNAAIAWLRYNRPTSKFPHPSDQEEFLYCCFDAQGQFSQQCLGWILYKLGVLKAAQGVVDVEDHLFPDMEIADLITPDVDVLCVKPSILVTECLKRMAEREVLSVPVYSSDSSTHCNSFFDLQDLLACIFAGKDLGTLLVGDARNKSHADVYWAVEGSLSLSQLLEVFSRGVHRVPVVDKDRVVAIVSQSSLVSFLAYRMDLKDQELNQTLDALGVISKTPLAVSLEGRTREAFRRMHDAGVEAAAVVEEESGKLRGTVSVEGLRGQSVASILQQELELSVEQFVARHPLELTKSVACLASTSLREALLLVSEARAHRAWIIDAHGVLKGIVSLGDLLRAAMKLATHHLPHRRDEIYFQTKSK